MLGDEIRPRSSSFFERTPLPRIDPSRPQLVLLAAGRGTRFGAEPKCSFPILGVPLAGLTIASFACVSANPSLCVVGYQSEEVMGRLGDGERYVVSSDPTGGTAWAALEAVSVPEVLDANPLLLIAMGDRIIPPGTFEKILAVHKESGSDLTFLALHLHDGSRRGKGRVILGPDGQARSILEQSDIDRVTDPAERKRLDDIDLVNCPLYVVSARRAHEELRRLGRANAQSQYYLTDMVAAMAAAGARVRACALSASDPSFALLSCDLTSPGDVARVEKAVRASCLVEAIDGAAALKRDRPRGQIRAVARQLLELSTMELDADRECSIAVAGGRLRIAFMHPDMVRFYGPAWQVPIGSADALDRHQIVALVQPRNDNTVTLSALNPSYRDDSASLPADAAWSFPGPEVADWYAYESFGTALSRQVLLLLGFVDEGSAQASESSRQPGPSRTVEANLRRPFPLVMNALASLRTTAAGPAGERSKAELFPPRFRGLSVIIDGDIPRGGFSSSSAVTVAMVNALNSLFGLGLTDERLVSIACQAEFGTGVRAGSLDQATEQMGNASAAAIVSSNPRDGYRVLGRFPMPVERIRILFPYSVDRDREAWKWSAGQFGRDGSSPALTTGEIRKLTGKAAEIACLLLRLPFDIDLFKQAEGDLIQTGALSAQSDATIRSNLGRLPVRISRDDLTRELQSRREWVTEQYSLGGRERDAASRANRLIASVLEGWREPRFHDRSGVPLRAIVGYLYAEVAKCFHLVHHPEDWIESVNRSQAGDRWFTIDPTVLPSAEMMVRSLSWERHLDGPSLLQEWLSRHGAAPHDYDLDIDDESLATGDAVPPRLWRGTSFFRGLALLDLVEAMLKRAFGEGAVALRVNAAGQGDYYQVHIDTHRADPQEVKAFIRSAVYRRFALSPDQEFVEVQPGGAAAAARLGAFSRLPLVARLLSY